ncbi:MAG: hypothetical protein K6E11_03690 [Bacilli bacterium]|nr:hypothetical protein [Bacilli bacterium]
MNIVLSKKDEEELRYLLDVKDNNISAAEIYIEYLTNHPLDIEKSNVEKVSFFKAFLSSLEINENDEDFQEININSRIDEIEELDPQKYLDDDYAKLIKNISFKDSDWELLTLYYEPYQGFVYDELEIDDMYFKEHTPLGYFKEKFPYLAIIQGDLIWMSVIPHEINTMRKPIKDAFGRVLVLGLGLGYYAYHVSNKEDVESITIVENDIHAINIFKKYILPHFENKNKIKIVNADAFEYLKEGHDFDFVFADIWHNVGDGLMSYLKIKAFENEYKTTTFEYWIETSILAMLRRMTLTVFEENYFEHFKESDYLKARDDNDRIINAIYFAIKDKEFKSIEDIRKILQDDSLKELARSLTI